MNDGLGDSFDLDLAAASLHADARDVHFLLKLLARQLSDALGERLVVQRKGGLLKKSDQIRAVQISMGDDRFEAVVDGPTLSCTIGRVSGGIRIRSERVDIDEWLRRLLEALQTEAAHSSAAREALENIVIGGPQ